MLALHERTPSRRRGWTAPVEGYRVAPYLSAPVTALRVSFASFAWDPSLPSALGSCRLGSHHPEDGAATRVRPVMLLLPGFVQCRKESSIRCSDRGHPYSICGYATPQIAMHGHGSFVQTRREVGCGHCRSWRRIHGSDVMEAKRWRLDDYCSIDLLAPYLEWRAPSGGIWSTIALVVALASQRRIPQLCGMEARSVTASA